MGNERSLVRPIGVQPLNIGEDQESLGTQGNRQGPGGGIRVDVIHLTVVEAGGNGGDHGNASGINDVHEATRVHIHDLPHQADVGELPIDLHQAFFRLKQAGVLPGGAHRVRAMIINEPHQVAANLAE